jgi:hypothetical protein
MNDDLPQVIPGTDPVAAIRSEIQRATTSRKRRIGERFIIAALGSIPWIGGFIAAAASIPADDSADRGDSLRNQWLEEHQRKLGRLQDTLGEVEDRFESLGPSIEERIQSEEYLALVRQAFRTWDEAETDEKRRYVANVVTNSADTRICSDDVIRLFISWLDLYHEAHFAVIRNIFKNPGTNRYDIWVDLYGDIPREDSAEADLYRLLIRDLSMGGVIRQSRDVNEVGQFLRKRPVKRRGPAASTMESAFEDSKQYVLTELGKQFVHYTMNEIVDRLPKEASSA